MKKGKLISVMNFLYDSNLTSINTSTSSDEEDSKRFQFVITLKYLFLTS